MSRVVALLALAGVTADLALWAQGERTFVTHPVSALSLAVAAVLVTRLAARPPALALGVALAVYLLLGGWATAAPESLSTGLWSAGWLPVNALLAAVGLSAAGLRRTMTAFLSLTAVVTVGGALLVRPVAPFAGIATAAPEGWEQTAPGLVDGLLVVWNAALVAVTAAVFFRATRASILDRGSLARAAAVTSTAPCLVVVCFALAVLRDPGEVDPTTGSVAYTAATAGLAVLAAWGATGGGVWPVRLIAGTWTAAVVVLAGVVVAGPVTEANVTVGVIAVAVLTAGTVAAARYGVTRFEAWSRPPPPRAVTRSLPGLSPRENDVLTAVASGGTNAAVAAELFLSERTVEQHLRSIFDKLDLGDHGGSNRRVRASALWWQHQRADQEQERLRG